MEWGGHKRLWLRIATGLGQYKTLGLLPLPTSQQTIAKNYNSVLENLTVSVGASCQRGCKCLHKFVHSSLYAASDILMICSKCVAIPPILPAVYSNDSAWQIGFCIDSTMLVQGFCDLKTIPFYEVVHYTHCIVKLAVVVGRFFLQMFSLNICKL